MIKIIAFTLIFAGILLYSDSVLYDIAYQTGESAAAQKWRDELIVKNYAGYNEKSGNWEYLKETDVLLRLLLKYNDKPSLPPVKDWLKQPLVAPKGMKLELQSSAPITDMDFLNENDKFSLISPPKTSKKK